MQTFYFTDPGKVRSHNEDSVTIISNDKKEKPEKKLTDITSGTY